MSEGQAYGIHFPSKRGAEMVLAYLDGNPDRPLGLGFVPNAASPSVINNRNSAENIIRSWGGNTLVMTDTHRDKSVKLTTPEERYVELYDGKKLVRVKSEHCELLFNDEEQYAEIDAGGHKIRVDYAEDGNRISIKTVNGAIINMDDEDDIITLQTAAEEGGKKTNLVVLNGKDEAITIDSKDNTGVFNGKEARITLESKDSKVAIDGKGQKITIENKDAQVAVDGGKDTITLATQKVIIDAQKDISLKAGGKIIFDAKGGISNKSMKQNLEH
jgi:type VI secretion system secreted protein VgrG